MGIQIEAGTEYAKEMAKWNKPYVFQPFPRMLYLAHKRPDGIVSVSESEDGVFGDKAGAAEAFTRKCQTIVHDETSLTKHREMGWCESPQEALEDFERRARGVANAAAERAYDDRRMSEPAKAEARAVEAQSFDHTPEIPEKPLPPKRKLGRPRGSRNKKPAA